MCKSFYQILPPQHHPTDPLQMATTDVSDAAKEGGCISELGSVCSGQDGRPLCRHSPVTEPAPHALVRSQALIPEDWPEARMI